MTASAWRPITDAKKTGRHRLAIASVVALLILAWSAGTAAAASPCDSATYPTQCGYFASGGLPPFVQDAIVAKGGVLGAGNVLVLTSGLPDDADSEISNDMSHDGCGTNPDGWQTYDCTLLDNFVPAEDSVVLALSSEWFEWYQTFYTDWMTISAGGVPTVDVSINSWINNKVDIIPYGPADTGVVILTSLSKAKMVSFRVADSGDHIYDTAILVVPATWFGAVSNTSQDQTLLCGNNTLDPGEECDDGNSNTDDGCSSICLGTQPPASTPNPSQTCGNLAYAWPTGLTSPYTCGADLCGGYRCVLGSTISPACYTAEQCAAACAGTCVDIPTAQLDCSVMCAVQPPASAPPPVVPPSCTNLVYVWPGGTTMPYTCDDACAGQRCVIGTTISPECYTTGECAAACSGTCVDVPTTTCMELCDLADQVVAELSSPCNPLVDLDLRSAANQNGPCYGNMEICKSTGTWEIADGGWEPQDEACNGIDDNCNGIVDDMFETCGDPGLCQNTVNTCDPSNPAVPVPCVTLPAPSPVEICNDGLDNDCDGSADDGCECPDEECMPGETYANCPQDCPPPANFTACDDGNFCTLGDVYQSGVCVSGTIVNTCDDDNACTTNEVCDPVAGCSATKVDCDDHNECTLDGCDPSSGCTHDPNPACQTDADSDGYPSLASGGTDCDDGNAAIHPGAAELCNAADDDCDTQVDEGFNIGTACQSAPNSCGVSGDGTLGCAGDGLSAVCSAVTPADPAGYGAPCTSEPNACGATAQGTGLCDGTCSAPPPANPAGYGDPCASEPNACGATAQGTRQCDGTCNAVTPPAADADGDATPDCLDLCPNDAAKVAPGVCGCDAPETVNTYYRDADADGFGNALVSTQACSAPAGYVSGNTDCDDANASVHPGAAEICNGIDDNCDGQLEVAGDADKDGVVDCGADLCPGTRADSKYMPRVPLLWLGANRWEVRNVGGKLVWATTKPTSSKPTMADTHGCSCKQILDRLIMSPIHPRQRVDLLAQYLLGCTMGTLADWADR